MNITAETVSDSTELVGVEFKKNKYSVFFPIGYNSEEIKEINFNDQKQLNEVLNLLKIISEYKDKKESSADYNQTGEKTEDFPLGAYYEIISYYAANGYYKEKETEYTTETRGRINWKRTIQQKKAFATVNNGVLKGPYYTDFVVRKNRINENNIITQIHKVCVEFSLSRIGWLLGLNYTPNEEIIVLKDNIKDIAVSVLNDKLSSTFNDRLKRLFGSMLMIFENNDFENMSFADFTVGTKYFQNVWEKVIDDFFGIPEKERQEYNPKITWKLSDDTEDTKENNKVNSLIIDTIMVDVEAKDNNVIYILDAKYYKKDSFPDSSSILKQIAYGDSVYYKLKNKPKIGGIEISDENLKNINNAFILPYDYSSEQDKIKYIKKVSVDCFPVNDNDNDNKHREIKAIYFDTKTLLELVYKSESEKQNMKKKLCEAIKN